MITVNQEMLNAALAQHKLPEGQTPDQVVARLKEKAVVNVAENIFEEGDTFTMPANEEEFKKVLIPETYERLARTDPATGEKIVPEGFSALVYVENSKNGNKAVKKFRVTSATASFNEYAKDSINETYLATGRVVRSEGDVATLLRTKNNQYEQFAALFGKTITTKKPLVGNAAVMSDGMPKGIRRRTVADFAFVND
jgi:hypothetical protein